MIKNKLNEFQADWAAMPQVEKEQLAKLRNKTILVSGHALARCFCYALLFQNETRQLNIKVIFAMRDRKDFGDLYAELILRGDLNLIDYSSFGELKNVDYIVHTGFCCETTDAFSRSATFPQGG